MNQEILETYARLPKAERPAFYAAHAAQLITALNPRSSILAPLTGTDKATAYFAKKMTANRQPKKP